jgi:hypothetical protein
MEVMHMDKARPLRRVVIKEEYISLTGDHVSAVLLGQIEYWTMRIHDFDRFLAEEKAWAKTEGKSTGIQFRHGWIYKTAEDLSAETMMGLSAGTIRTRLKRLMERGWISERNNPDHLWDRTRQYRFNAGAVATGLERLGYHLEGWTFVKENPETGKPHGYATANFADASSNSEDRAVTVEDRTAESTPRTFKNCGAIPEITTEIRDRNQQQPDSDQVPVVDRSPKKDVVVAQASIPIVPEQELVSNGPVQREIQDLIGFARAQAHEIILSDDYAGEIIQMAGSLAAAKEKIGVAGAYIDKELRAGHKINSVKGIMNRILQMDTGGIKLGRSQIERDERIAEKEKKYKDVYLS